jgi:RND family efflux transporter MFP subunit
MMKILRLAIFALCFCGAARGETKGTPAKQTEETNPLLVKGLVTPVRQFELASPSEGLVTSIPVQEGDKITAGQAVGELSSEQEKIILRQMDLQSRKQSEDLSSMKRLYEEKAVSRDEYTKAMLGAEQAAAERDLAAIRLKERSITSPQSGVVLRLMKDEGESVRKLESFAEIVDIDRLHVTAYLPVSHLGKVSRGDKVPVLPEGEQGDPIAGEVELVDPVLDPGGEVFRVKVLVPRPTGRLLPGTRATVDFSAATK